MRRPLTGKAGGKLDKVRIYANSHYVTPGPTMKQAAEAIRFELAERLKELNAEGRLLPTERNDLPAPENQRALEYVVPATSIGECLPVEPTPMRWQLDRKGMYYDWHEYGCYVTWFGLGLAGLAVLILGVRALPLAPDSSAAYVLQGGIATFWVAYLAPWCFIHTGLAGRDSSHGYHFE